MRNWASLTNRADFLRLQQQGRKWITPNFIVLVDSSRTLSRPVLGLTVTKKLGKAVIRNTIKRRLRATADLAALPAWQISLIARHGAAEQPVETLRRDLGWALQRLEKVDQENAA